MAAPVPTEAQEARTLAAYLRVRGYKFTHIANETGSGRGARFQGIRNKQQGVSPGFPDYIVLVNDNIIFIELKRTKGGVLSQAQKDWIAALEEAGQTVRVCKGAQAAIDFIEEVAHDQS